MDLCQIDCYTCIVKSIHDRFVQIDDRAISDRPLICLDLYIRHCLSRSI